MSNHIKFGDKSYQVSYIQSFLRDNYSKNVLATNVYDKQTHQALIKYLNQPNVEDMSIVERKIEEQYNELSTLFKMKEENNSITYISKTINQRTSDFITLFIDDIKETVKNLGWKVSSYNNYIDYSYDINGDNAVDGIDRLLLQNYISSNGSLTKEQLSKADFNLDGTVDMTDYNILVNYLENKKLYITIEAEDRKNFFPNKDMLNFINLFNNDFQFYSALRNGDGDDDFIHDDIGLYKLCFIECKPGTEYTIVHGSSEVQELVIGSMVTNMRNRKSLKLQNVIQTTLNPGEPIVYTTSQASDTDKTAQDAKYIVIQCSSNIEGLSSLKENKEQLWLGNINFDKDTFGNQLIDNADRKLLSDYLYYPEGDLNRPNLTKKQLAAADVNQDGKIDADDLQLLADFIDGKSGLTSLGVIEYKYYTPRNINELNDVASFLVVEGDITSVPIDETKQSETSIEHQEVITTLSSKEEHTDSNNNVAINVVIPANPEKFDTIKYQGVITRFDGNSKQAAGNKDIHTERVIETTSILSYKVFAGNTEQLSKNDIELPKLIKINDIVDYIYLSQNKYNIHKNIGEFYTIKNEFIREGTNVTGKYYLRSKNPTIFKPCTNINDMPNLLSNKLNTVTLADFMNVTSKYESCVTIDMSGRLCIYVKEWETYQQNDMLYWLRENPLYVYGELKTPEISPLSIEIDPIQLKDNSNKIYFNKLTGSTAPSSVTIDVQTLGVNLQYIEVIKPTYQVYKSKFGINFSTFTTNPWIVNSKFMSYLLGQSITPYSRSEDITYAQNLIKKIYPLYNDSFIPGYYSDLLRELIEKYQRSKVSYGIGDLNKDGKIDEIDYLLLKRYLNNPELYKLSETQLKLADVNRDTKVTIDDLNMIRKEVDGINDDLKNFDIQFLMGYIDPLTEYKMLKDIHSNSWNNNSKEVGWYNAIN